MDAGDTVTKQDYGDGKLQINYSGAHGLLLGEFVRVYQSSVYDFSGPIIEVVDSDSIKMDIAYDATAGTVKAFDMKEFQQMANNDPQLVGFKDITPNGAKILEWQLLYTNDESGAVNPVTASIDDSYLGNMTSMNGSWLNGHYFTAEG